MKRLYLAPTLALLLMLSACAATNQHPMYETSVPDAPPYPRISLLVNDGYVSRSTNCTQYGCNTFVDKTHANALEYLRDSRKFSGVEMNNAYVPYKLIMETGTDGGMSGMYNFTKFLIGAASLFLIPMRYEMTYNAKFVLLHKDQPIDHFQYSRDTVIWHFLFVDLRTYDKQAYDSILSNLLHDIEERDSFGMEQEVLDVAGTGGLRGP